MAGSICAFPQQRVTSFIAHESTSRTSYYSSVLDCPELAQEAPEEKNHSVIASTHRTAAQKTVAIPVREAATKPEAVQCLRDRKKISKSASSVSDCVRRRAAASALSAASLNAVDTSSSPRPRRARFSFFRVLRDLCSR